MFQDVIGRSDRVAAPVLHAADDRSGQSGDQRPQGGERVLTTIPTAYDPR